jgi:hypothetical protein
MVGLWGLEKQNNKKKTNHQFSVPHICREQEDKHEQKLNKKQQSSSDIMFSLFIFPD